jgi:hypothetical protein
VKRTSSSRFLCLALLLVVSAAISQSALAQTISVQAVPLHRFITQNATLGHFLTSDYSQGTGNPYNYAYQPFPYQADIVPLVPGYVPQSGQGLTPVHAWQVIQSPRIYYYYSIFYAPHGSNYHYQGIIGYAMASNDPRGTPLNYWYSQSYGYYYTLNGEYPPCCTFANHGTSWNLPVGGTFLFDKIPDPVDPCEGMEVERQECFNAGDRWNPDTCTCETFCRYGNCELQY